MDYRAAIASISPSSSAPLAGSTGITVASTIGACCVPQSRLLQPDSAYATAFHIDVSIDGSKFWTVARTTDSGAGLTGIQLDAPVTARYIRVVADRPDGGGQTGGQMAISELAAYSLR